jgi:NAD(P)-dependent dehydrogenase (short-subunit alcohol dehydrogenase family)
MAPRRRNAEFRRNVGFYYDLVKANVERIVKGLSAELEDSPVTAVGVTPGWLRSEKMLENFGVSEGIWRDACRERPGFGISESPTYVARGVAGLARAADAERWAGTIVSARQPRRRLRRDRHRRKPTGLLGLSRQPTGGSPTTPAASTSSGKSERTTASPEGTSRRLRLR